MKKNILDIFLKHKPNYRNLFYFLLILIIGLAFLSFNNSLVAQSLQTTPPPMKLGGPMPENLFIEMARIINPSIVNISTSVIPKGRQMRDPLSEMLEQFYGYRFEPRQESGKPRRMGLGTGFVIREDGLIVTNTHVIKNADIVEVQFSENDEFYTAKVIGSDERSDIALIKIDAKKKLQVAVLGNSKDLQVGEWVGAFGNPYGHGHTVTKGIISSIGREIEQINRFPLIQTDASINPGNSGGPLVNSKGYVIGVNSAIDARAQGIGFAIPIDEVKKILPQLEARGSIQKGYLGAGLGDIDPSAADEMGLDSRGEFFGAVILQLDPNGPAKKAGLKEYDLIREINGRKIKNSVDLQNTVFGLEPGQKVDIKVLRSNKELKLNLTIAERPEEAKLKTQTSISQLKPIKAPHDLGFSLADLNSELKEQWNIPGNLEKPVIVEIERNSMATRFGFQVGDIILEVNKVEVKSAKQALDLIKKGKRNSIKVGRGNRLLAVTFDL